MNYLSTVQAAAKWGISANRITILAKNARIPGAIQIGSRWMIPENTEKPVDGRTKSAKSDRPERVFFRFPLYTNFDESSYVPPLSPAEHTLRQGQLDFYACRFEEARKLLLPLAENEKNIYIRLAALYFLCMLAFYDNSVDFDRNMHTFNVLLAQDFPYKKEMLLLRYAFDAELAYYQSMLEDFFIDPEYPYHASAYNVLLVLSLLPVENGDLSLLSKLRYDTYELLCQQMEHDGYFREAQNLHYTLLMFYQLQRNPDRMAFHIRRGLEIAFRRELYWQAAVNEHFFPDVTHKVLEEFPAEFAEKICSLGNTLHEKYLQFESNRKTPSYFNLLSANDFELAFLASQGFTNQQIAKSLKISEKTVSKKYSVIYDKLGIKTKQELVALINNTHKNDKLI